ncbi:MAG: hypothetical protein HQM14_19075 [SAR324 cluster bacterium]|nr:hypothetical protein [SAR324 cluster bacterium]
MNLASIIIGIVCIPIMFLGFIPLLGWLNWVVLPSAVIGAIVGAFGDKKTGLIVNIIVFVVGALRLSVGGGLL